MKIVCQVETRNYFQPVIIIQFILLYLQKKILKLIIILYLFIIILNCFT